MSQRILVTGRPLPELLPEIRGGLPDSIPESATILFVHFAEQDVAVGTDFIRACSRASAQDCTDISASLIAVTQQMFKPFDLIPIGWKTIALIDFPLGLPALVSELPEVQDWYEATDDRHIYLEY